MRATLRKTLYALAACLYIVSGTGMADDTEVYFGGTTSTNNTLPNVLFVLDTSSSMNSTVPSNGLTRLQNMKDALISVLQTANNVNVGLMRFSNTGGPVLFPVSNIDADAADIEGAAGGSGTDVLVRVDQGSDDAEEDAGGGAVNIDSTDLELVRDTATGSGLQTVGIRFQEVLIPQGVTITTAHVLFTTDEVESANTDVTIRGELTDDAATFDTTPGSISSRTQTTASVDWINIPAWNTVDEVHQSPDLSAVVQEIVDQGPTGGWCGGNAMALIMTGTGVRTAESYNGESDSSPQLYVEWDGASIPAAPGGCIRQTVTAQVKSSSDDAEEKNANGLMSLTSSDLELVKDGGDQTIGVRFQNLEVPPGATILNAELEFEVDVQHTTSVTLTIEGEDPSNGSPSFSNTDDDITDRSVTSNSVNWTPPGSAVNAKLISPDLSAVVQEITDDSDWNDGDDMVFVITGTGSGKREVESYDGEAGAAPVLRISYEATATDPGATVKTVRQRLIEIVDDIQYKSGTPIVDTLYEAARYYRGEDIEYGDQRGLSSTSRREFTRVSHAASYTGGTLNQPAGCTYNNLNAVACRDETITGNPTYTSPITSECQGNYMVLLSDGEPSVNSSVSLVETMIGGSCAGSGSGKCGNELVDFLLTEDQIADATLEDDQTVTTHTIGFAFDGDPAYLQELSDNGGGNFYTADDATELTDAFEEILGSILEGPTSFAAPSLSVNAFNKLFNLSSVYFALFEPSNSQTWVGNVKKFQICSDPAAQSCTLGEVLDKNGDPAIGTDFKIKSEAVSFWGSTQDGPEVQEGGAGAQIPAHASRTVLTYTGVDFPGSPVLLDSSHYVNTTNVTPAMVGVATNAERDDIVAWLRGQDVNDEDGDLDTTDDRWAFADPLHSRPITVTYGAELTGGNPDPTKPIIKILVGTNDGGLRMINEKTGEEEWIFYPKEELLLKAEDLMIDNTGSHIYGLDGTPSVFIEDVDGDGIIEPADGDKVQIFFGQRRGGPNLYALDLTPTSTLTTTTSGQITPEFMWHIEGGTGDYANLGDTWSTPLVTQIRVHDNGNNTKAHTVLVMGGGYEAPEQDDAFGPTTTGTGNAIYIVDAEDGTRWFWASDTGSGADLEVSGMDHPIPSDIALLDSNGDFETDRLYAVDSGGQVFRIDLDDDLDVGDAVDTTGGMLAQISVAGPPEDDERRMYFTVDVAEVRDETFSDVPEYDAVVVGTGFRAHPNDIDVHDRIYMFRDYLFDVPVPAGGGYPICNDGSGGTSPCGGPITEDPSFNLVDLTDNLFQDGTPAQQDQVKLDLLDSNGWYIVLKEDDGSFVGEKVLAKAIILDGIIFMTTFTPASAGGAGADPCAANEGTGKVYALNLFNAGAVIDFGGDGSLDKGDRTAHVGGGIPSEVVPVFQDEGVTLLIGSGGGAAAVDPGIGLPRERSYWLQEF